jgi:hypothetical protein
MHCIESNKSISGKARGESYVDQGAYICSYELLVPGETLHGTRAEDRFANGTLGSVTSDDI